MRALSITVLLLALFATAADARPRVATQAPECPTPVFCYAGAGNTQFLPSGRESGGRRANYRRTSRVAAGHGAQIVGHPPGCPRRLFCGCGAAVRVFGSPRRDLWLAANWLRFPRTAPAPGKVAARRGHVFVLERHIEGNVWLVYDANSGGRQTRIHPRSIAGYTIVNPHA